MKKKSNVWFKKVRGSYLPSTWQGWLLYVPFVYFLVVVYMAIDKEGKSAFDVFLIIFPQWVAAAVVMTWIAKQKS
jgi:hypothetical protein